MPKTEISSAEMELRQKVSRYVKAQLKLAGVTYDQLIERLADAGMHETKAGIANMLNRGSFPATFLVAAMQAIERDAINLKDL